MAAAGAIAGGGVTACTFDGSLSKINGSASTVTGTTRTCTVPSGNSGVLQFDNVALVGAPAKEYSKNAGAFTAFVEDTQITLANTDTLAIRITGDNVNDEV